MSTGHSNSAADMLSRLETMILMGMDLPLGAVRGQLASAIDLIIHLSRFRDRSRKLMEVTEVLGMREGRIQLSTLYRFVEEEERDGKIIGRWVRENGLYHTFKMEAAGIQIR